MIITRNEVKELLSISGGDKDSLIDMLIPAVEQGFFSYTHNYFVRTDRYKTASTLSFNATSPATIVDSAAGFVTAKFSAPNFIRVKGSLDNDGLYQIQSVAAGTLTLHNSETLKAEAQGESVTIWICDIPANVKVLLANMIGFDLDNVGPTIKSEKTLNYSVTFETVSGRYPESILQAMNNYRMIPWP